MRVIISIITIFIMNCSTIEKIDSKNSNEYLELNMSVKKGTVFLFFTNNSKKNVSINNPCLANTFIHILNDKKKVQRKIRIKIDPNCSNELHLIEANTTKEFRFTDYTLSQLFNLEKGVEYEIYCEYYANQKKLNSNNAIQSEIIKFKNEK